MNSAWMSPIGLGARLRRTQGGNSVRARSSQPFRLLVSGFQGSRKSHPGSPLFLLDEPLFLGWRRESSRGFRHRFGVRAVSVRRAADTGHRPSACSDSRARIASVRRLLRTMRSPLPRQPVSTQGLEAISTRIPSRRRDRISCLWIRPYAASRCCDGLSDSRGLATVVYNPIGPGCRLVSARSDMLQGLRAVAVWNHAAA